MSGEQGDVERPWASQLIARNRELQAALERAEQKRDHFQRRCRSRFVRENEQKARAEKAERALAEMREALREIEAGVTLVGYSAGEASLSEIARAALRPLRGHQR